MTLLEKKKKAAAIAVACFLQQEMNKSKAPQNQWGKLGKSRMMDGRAFLLRKGRTPGPSK